MSDLIARLREKLGAGIWDARAHADWTAVLDRAERAEAERDSFYMDYRMKCDTETKALAAKLARAEAALEWYAEKAQAVARHMQATPPKPEGCLAILTEMSLDGGRRRDAYFAEQEPRT